MAHTTAFKTPEGEAEYLAAYKAAMKELWPVPYEEMEIPSRFGKTHAVASGPEDAPPLVLLHGSMGNLTMWAPYIAELSKAYRIYALDTMGHLFTIGEMILVGSSYWNFAFGGEKGAVLGDEEGMQTMRRLGENLAWVLERLG
jgi:multimeric flavodoxin WrbA